jgi:hypothetical protein
MKIGRDVWDTTTTYYWSSKLVLPGQRMIHGSLLHYLTFFHFFSMCVPYIQNSGHIHHIMSVVLDAYGGRCRSMVGGGSMKGEEKKYYVAARTDSWLLYCRVGGYGGRVVS